MENVTLNDQLHFPATLKNQYSIADVLTCLIPHNGVLLEIASGSVEH